MTWDRSAFLALSWPVLAGCGGSAGLVYAVTGEPAAALAAVLGGLAVGAVFAMSTLRDGRRAAARLRHASLRGAGGCGAFAGVLQEASTLVEQHAQTARDAEVQKTALEARTHVRRRERVCLEAALQSVEHPVVVVDDRNTAVFANGSAHGLAGDGAEFDVTRLPELQRLVETTRERSAATDARTAELEHGGTAWRATATNARDARGRPLGVVLVLQDVHDEKEANTRHAEFVSSASHELKTPLASIKAFVEMLRDGDVDDAEERDEVLGFVDEQVDRLTRLVQNMLNLARIESGVVEVQREDCELNDVLSAALEVVEPAAAEKSITLVSRLSDLYLPVYVDPDLLGQAVLNLLSNAVKYTPAGGEVRLKSRMDEGVAVCEIRDTGMGIPEESLSRLFERFYRVPENNEAASGTGLGLSLVHDIVSQLHNGRVSVESKVGEGTCFTITLPLGHRDNGRGVRRGASAEPSGADGAPPVADRAPVSV